MATTMIQPQPVCEVAEHIFDWPKVPESNTRDEVATKKPTIKEPILLLSQLSDAEERRVQNTSHREQKKNTASGAAKPKVADISSTIAEAIQPRISERRWLNLGRGFTFTKSTWPDPQLSLGTKCNRLGGNECWEAIGPAQELFSKISANIGELLDALIDDLEEGEPVDGNILTFGMYMIGKNPATARPTLLFTCQTPNPRRRAIKFLKESAVLKGHPKIALAESSVSPLIAGRRYLRLLAGLSSSDAIALGIGIGLGIPVFTFGLLATYFFSRRRKRSSPVVSEPYQYSVAGEMSSSAPYPHGASPWSGGYRVSQLSSINFTRHELPHSYSQVVPHNEVTTSNSLAFPDPIYEIGMLPPIQSKPAPGPYPPGPAQKPNLVARLDLNTPPHHPRPTQAMKQIPPDSYPYPHLRHELESPPPAPLRPSPIPYPRNISHALGVEYSSTESATKFSAPRISTDGRRESNEFGPSQEGRDFQLGIQEPLSQEPLSANTYGTSIVCLLNNRRATVGGSIYLKGSYYGLTVGHIFNNPFPSTMVNKMEVPMKSQEDEFEFAFDDENEGELNQADTSGVAITSQASVSSSRSVSHIETTNSTSSRFEIQIQHSQLDPTAENSERRAKEVAWPTASSVSGTQLGLDWALFKIPEPDVIDTIKPVNNGLLGDVVLPQRVVSSLVKEKDVVAVTGHSGILLGKISSSTTMMRLSPGSKFQEVWTVRLSGHIGEGDSGSWVLDTDSGDLYGHIVAGVPSSPVVYIVPAYKIFEDIKCAMGSPVHLNPGSDALEV